MYFFSLFLPFVCSSGISVHIFVLMRVQCRIEAQPRCLVVRRSVSLFCIRHFRTANSTPFFSISRNPAPFEKLSWKDITLKRLLKIGIHRKITKGEPM
jgi:hypothetical protein